MSGATEHTGLRALTAEKERVFLTAIEEGLPLRTAARTAGLGERTVKQWLEIGTGERQTWFDGTAITDTARADAERFATKVAAALDRFEQTMVGSIRHAATTVNPKTGTYDWRAGLALLTHHPAYRSTWREERHVDVQHSGTISFEHQLVQQLEPQELEAAYHALDVRESPDAFA